MNIRESEFKIEKLNFSTRTYNCLKINNINTVRELLGITEDELRVFRNLGAKSLQEIKDTTLKLISGNFILEELECRDNKLIDNANFTMLNLIVSTNKKISNILFYSENEGYSCDIKIKDMNLSVRSLNALKNNGYEYVSQLLELHLSSLNKIKNLGKKSKDEIIDSLKAIVHVTYSEDNINEVKYIEEICNAILEDYKQSLVEYDTHMLKLKVFLLIKRNIDIANVVDNKIEELITYEEVLQKIYSNDFLVDLLKRHFVKWIKKNDGSIELSEIIQSLPNHLKLNDIPMNILNYLIEAKQIEQVKGKKYRIWYPNLYDYINSLEDEREKLILYNRFQGKTLEETGKQIELTKERVRQLEKRAVNRIPRIREDDYRESFEKYPWTPELFKHSYNESDLTYGYLKSKYNKGNRNLENILEDINIATEVRLRVEKLIFRDYISVGNSRIKMDRQEILDYILRTYCRDEVTFRDLYELYSMFLEDYELDKKSELMYSERYFEATLSNSKKVLWKFGKKLRYYDFTEMNERRIVEALNLQQFENVEYSTLKFFNDYIDIMKEWDIRDEYELHNLMKKVFSESNELNITLSRMPNIEFGKPDRDMQVLDLLLQTAPIENYKLAKLYEQEYGVKAETVLANNFKCIDEFYHNGVYTIDSETLIGDEYERMKEKLVDDSYLIKDVRKTYIELFPNGNLKLINPYNLKRLGFRVNTSIIYSDRFTNLEQYFRTIILKDDIFDATLLDTWLTGSQTYYYSLQRLKVQFEIVEFSPNKFVNIRRLEQNGIGKKKLQEFIDDVYEFVNEELFTIKALRKKGFEHKLDELGFDDWFYSSLLRYDTRFKSRRFEGNILFRKGFDVVTLNDLIEHIVSRHRSIDIYDLMEIIYNDYGITVEKNRIPYIIKEKELYYNTIMEKVYIDYDEYFEEV